MNDSEKTVKPNLLAVTGIILIIMLIVVIAIASVKSAPYADSKHRYSDFSQGWEYENGEEARLERISGNVSMHKTLPEMERDMVLSFNARNLDADVYVDGMCIYEHTSFDDPVLKRIFGKTGGSAFAEVPVLKEYAGKDIVIEITCPYSNSNACRIVNMYFGDGVSIVKHDASVQLGAFCISMIILFVGIICLLLYFPMHRHDMVDSSMLYLGMFAFVFGMTMIADNKLLHLVVGHETLYYTMSQMFMILIPLPMLLFFEKLYGNLNKKLVAFLCILDAADLAGIFILSLAGAADYYENTPIVLALCAVSILYIGVVTVKEAVVHRGEKVFHNIGVLMFVISTVLDMAVLRMSTFAETSFFMRIGIAGLITLEFVQILWTHIQNYQKSVKSQIISRLAYYDGLTDLLNRTSFMEDMKKLEDEQNEEILFGVFDVNNLKYVNDTFGHSDGDELIISVSGAIGKAFGSMGKCYRTGGDEFVLISVCEDPEQKFIEAEKNMNNIIAEASRHSEYPVSVAAGYSVMNGRKIALKELLDEADENMYKNKRKMKSKEE